MRIILLSLLALTVFAAEGTMADLMDAWKKEDDDRGNGRMMQVWAHFNAIDKTPLKKIAGDPKDLTQKQLALNRKIDSYNDAYRTLGVEQDDKRPDNWRNIGPSVANLQRVRGEILAELKN